MIFKHFGLLILVRLAVLGITVMGYVYAFNRPDFHAVTLLMLLALCSLIYELWLFLNKTNREVVRFLSAARYADFNQSFDFEKIGGGFEDLGKTFTDILERLKKLRTTQELELRHLNAMVEHIPIPLLLIKPDDSLQLLNNAARKLFGITQPTKLADLRQYGNEFFEEVCACTTGENRLANISIEGLDTQVTLAQTEISSKTGTARLISLQDIGRELESTQLKAWQDLVRVLTHEIMNSITPVASLAQTMADMAEDAENKLEQGNLQKQDLHQISDAAGTVSRRASNLVSFVSNYRQLTRLPKPEKKHVLIKDIFDHVVRISAATDNSAGKKIEITHHVSPSTLRLYVDQDQIEQTLINLLQNARQALNNNGEIKLSARLNQRGRVVIEVSDNGLGIEGKILTKIFVPYFTTKPGGSGIGLALARQVLISHGGTIKAENINTGGAKLTLTF